LYMVCTNRFANANSGSTQLPVSKRAVKSTKIKVIRKSNTTQSNDRWTDVKDQKGSKTNIQNYTKK